MLSSLNTSHYNAPLSPNSNKNTEKNLTDKSQESTNQTNTQMINGVELTPSEVATVMKLQSIDSEVKAHEAAHMAAGGGLAGGASYGYTRGPDNKMYATSGEVPIRMQKGNTPEETIANARQVAAAAMAPANPSPQDYKVAANAAKMEMEARADAMRIKAEEANNRVKNQDKTNAENSASSNSNSTSSAGNSTNSNSTRNSTNSAINSSSISNSNSANFTMNATNESSNSQRKAQIISAYQQYSMPTNQYSLNIAS